MLFLLREMGRRNAGAWNRAGRKAIVMIAIRINGEERRDGEIDETWLAQSVNRRHSDNQLVCVEVTISVDGLNMRLRTPTCPDEGGAGRRPNAEEREILDVWHRLHLDTRDFTGGNVVAFYKQVRRFA